MRKLAVGVAIGLALSACGGSSASQTHGSPSPSKAKQGSPGATPRSTPTSSPAVLPGSFGVLSTFRGNSATYTVSTIATDGKVTASSTAVSGPPQVTCGDTAAAILPQPVSTSNTRVYYMDAQGVVRFLTPGGDSGRATTVPTGASTRSMFTVSPDDTRIVVVVAQFKTGGASTRMYIEDLNGGGNHIELFTESGSFGLWPTGWHGSMLVVAKVPTCTQGGGPGCCGPLEFHVVDPSTAVRSATVGNATNCPVVGPAMPAGAACATPAQINVLDWAGATLKSYSISGYPAAYLSPNGQAVAEVVNADTLILGPNKTLPNVQACGWIDDTHVFTDGDIQRQARVADVTSGTVTPTPAQGVCAGRIPGGLG